MRAIAIASSLAALAAAAAAERTENIRISKFLVRKNAAPDGTTIRVVDFKLDGDDAHGLGCTVQAPAYYPKPSEVSTCGSSKYRFALHPGNDTEFSLRIYHETGLAAGLWGEAGMPTYCHAGGDGQYDFVCDQVGEEVKTIVINSNPPPVDP